MRAFHALATSTKYLNQCRCLSVQRLDLPSRGSGTLGPPSLFYFRDFANLKVLSDFMSLLTAQIGSPVIKCKDSRRMVSWAIRSGINYRGAVDNEAALLLPYIRLPHRLKAFYPTCKATQCCLFAAKTNNKGLIKALFLYLLRLLQTGFKVNLTAMLTKWSKAKGPISGTKSLRHVFINKVPKQAEWNTFD